MADDGSDFARSMSIATSGLRAQAGRMRVISENIANADSTSPTAGGNPYRRKVPTFSSTLDRTLDAKVVTLGKVRTDQSEFRIKHEPSNPAADAAGNAVNLEDQMLKVSANQMDYAAATSLYSRSLGLLKTAIGRR
jgi:flagellar basal-body rod protein FlgC